MGIQKYLMKKLSMENKLKFIIQDFIDLLSFSRFSARVTKISDRTKCIYLNNETCLARPNPID